MYRLVDKGSGKFFVNPSFESWGLSEKEKEATIFSTIEEAKNVADEVNRASGMTFWDYSDIPPHAVVQPVPTK